MAAKLKIQDLPNQCSIVFEGVIDFSRIIGKISNEELERVNKNSKFPDKFPYYKIAIRNPKIKEVYKQNGSEVTEDEKQIIKEFVQQKLYKKASQPENVYIELKSKSKFAPKLFQNADGVVEDFTGKFPEDGMDLDNGLSVTVVTGTYTPKNNPNQGWGINEVIVNEKIRLYNSSPSGYFARHGINIAQTEPAPETVTPEVEETLVMEEPSQGIVMEGEGGNDNEYNPFEEIPF